MATDGDAAAGPGGHDAVARRSHADLVRCGAELVGLSERFYGGVFVAAIAFVGLSALLALVLMPLHAFPPGAPVTPAYVGTGLIIALTPLAAWRARALYCALRRSPALQLGPVLVAAALIVHPAMSGELWWPSCALLMALAVVAPLRRALAYCLFVLCTNIAGHLIAADLDETPAVAIVGLWIGYPLWVAAIAILTNRLAAHLLRLNAAEAHRAGREPPRRVHAWTTETPSSPAAEADETGVSAAEEPVTDRLTARQIQVVALLADGLRYREVAACLSISERQVQRHVAEAVTRLGIRNAYELVAVAISEGIVPGPAASAGR